MSALSFFSFLEIFCHFFRLKVDFDRTKHLSEREIQKRNIDRLKAIELEKIKNAQLEKEKDKAAKKQEIAKYFMFLFILIN